MRKRIWLLASCGIVGVGFGLCAADAPPGHLADELSALSLTDPVSTSPADGFARIRSTGGRRARKAGGQGRCVGRRQCRPAALRGGRPCRARPRKNPN